MATIDEALADSGDPELQPDTPVSDQANAPMYRVMGPLIPVSKSAGKLWSSRKDAAEKKRRRMGVTEAWEEAILYYKGNQLQGNNGTGKRTNNGYRRSSKHNQRMGEGYGNQNAENIVFSNTSALVPMLYAKNPQVDVVPTVPDPDNPQQNDPDSAIRDLATTAQKLINAMFSRKDGHGLNLKPKARKAVVMTTLTNVAYIESGYTKKEDSSDGALQELSNMAAKLKSATSAQEIQEIEGQIQALEEKVDTLNPSGPWNKFRHPFDVLVDIESQDPDHSDAKWMMIADYLRTDYINALFSQKDPESQTYKSIYQPTHIMPGSNEENPKDLQMTINNYTLMGDGSKEDWRRFGFADEASFKSAQITKVWYVWDKLTRRVMLFNDQDWCWPIWVWDDPYQLDSFFPIDVLQFYTDPEDPYGPSEVSMYLDQVDTINQINNEEAKIRNRAINTILYNTRAINDKSALDEMMKGSRTSRAIGMDWPPDADPQKIFATVLPPSAAYEKLFDKTNIYQTIEKLSSVTSTMQGEEFKTNTTNQAINTYNSQTQTRLDEKIDAVEDFIGNIAWKTLQMCLQFMQPQDVAPLVGVKYAQAWKTMTPEQIHQSFSVNVVGGSTQKPTSQVRKQEVLQLGQVLGQFAGAGGGIAVLVLLRMMERAWDDMAVSKNDFQVIEQAIMQNLQRGQSNGPQGQQPPQQGQPQPGQPGDIPPQIKQAVEALVAKTHMPPEQALQLIEQRLHQQQGQP